MSDTSNWSVYILTAPNGKKYIGTTSKKPRQRWNYGYGYRQNQQFFADIEKYGWNSIEKEIVATGLNQSNAHTLERELIEKYMATVPECGYNHAAGGVGTTGFYPTKESRAKMARSHIGKKSHCIPICQIDGDGNLVAVFPSAKEASIATGINYKSIINCRLGVTKQAGGYTWRYTD